MLRFDKDFLEQIELEDNTYYIHPTIIAKNDSDNIPIIKIVGEGSTTTIELTEQNIISLQAILSCLKHQ